MSGNNFYLKKSNKELHTLKQMWLSKLACCDIPHEKRACNTQLKLIYEAIHLLEEDGLENATSRLKEPTGDNVLGEELESGLEKAPEANNKLLIVDDDDNVLQALVRLFEDDDYEVFTARTGRKALNLLIQHNDMGVIITDQIMPGMTGTELLKKSHLVCPEARRILLCGSPNTYKVQHALGNQLADHFYKKPWDNRSLSEGVKNSFLTFNSRTESAPL